MQTPNAQGIAGLMSQGRAPQAPQQQQQAAPSPMKASPMASIGSVEDRVAAYRGNPAPLQQRYAMSQDLLDLLALQQIKSEKENAARQMQMQMAQQQAAQGAGEMTVAQQREKEVMELTKNELAQQRGETAQQQVGEQQANLQKVMSGGIARAPGAQTAAQPKMMAAGGIVAFNTGDPVEDPRRKRMEGENWSDYRRRMFNLEMEMAAERNRQIRADSEAERQRRLAERGGEVIPPSPFLDRPAGPIRPEGEPSAPPVSPTYPDETRRGAAAGLTALPAAPAGPAAPRPAGPAAPRPAGPAAPGAGPAAPAVPEIKYNAPTMGEVSMIPGVEKSIQQDVNRDPLAMQREQEDRIRKMYDLTPEQRKVYEEGIAQRRQMFDEAYNPERMRREGIKQFLLGAGGRRYGEFGGGAKAAKAYDEGARAQRRKDFEDLQKSREGLIGLERAGIDPSVKAGLEGLKAGSEMRRTSQTAGANIYGTDTAAATSEFASKTSGANTQYSSQMAARTADLDRKVNELKARTQGEANRIAREGLSFDRARTLYATTTERLQKLEKEYQEAFNEQNFDLLMAERSGKATPEQKQQLELARLELQRQKATARKELEPVLAPIRRQLGTAATTDMDPKDRELVDKFLKKGQ